jgi:23S rRNA G2445 N2-methylase RlmL
VNHVERLIGCFDGIGASRSELEHIQALVAGVDCLAPAAAARDVRGWKRHPPTFRVTAYRSGEHDYTSIDVSAAVGAGVVARHGWPVDLKDYDVEIVAHLMDSTLLLGVRLTREGSLHRRHRVAIGLTTLKASVAYSLLWLAGPKEDDVLLDPMCGSGVIPLEAASAWPGVTAMGGDISARELRAAADNVAQSGLDVSLCRWDARRLPFVDATVDCVVTDMPFGRRVGSHGRNRQVYPAVLTEVARVLRPGGRAVILTLERRLMARLLPALPDLELTSTLPIVLSNLRPSVYMVGKG